MDTPAYSVPLETSKRCNRCEGLLPLSDFSKDLSKIDGKSIYCRNCTRKINKHRRDKPDSKAKRKSVRHRYRDSDRNWRLKTRYGMTSSQFDTLFESQSRRCALCKSDKSDGKNFVVDHDHKTGKIRGILCSYCNRALGMFKDDAGVLKQAIDYLEK